MLFSKDQIIRNVQTVQLKGQDGLVLILVYLFA